MSCFSIRALLWIPLIIPLVLGQALACNTITLVSSNSHFGIAHRLEAILFAQPNLHMNLVHIIADNINETDFLNPTSQSCLIVAIGSQALSKVLKTKTTIPILSVLSRKNVFHQLLNEMGYSLNDPKHPITAIYLDQPLKRQLDLISCLFLKNTRPVPIGVLLGSQSIYEQETLQRLARKKNMELTLVHVNKFENPAEVLDVLLDDAMVVLTIPDNEIYNAETARGILLSAFHKRVPLIGYSRTFVNNGALAAVYSTSKQLAEQAAQTIIAIMQAQDKKLPPIQYPKEFAIAVNYQVARSLGMHIESESAIKLAISE